MSAPCPLIVFSDLDGTLIDHETYEWTAATQALDALQQIGAGLVLASSKTAAEIAVIRAEVGREDWPAIAENGAGLLPAGAAADIDATDYTRLRDALDALPSEMRQPFTGFGDMTTQGVADATGLSPEAAELAKTRSFSEPGIWSGDEQQKSTFLAALANVGISAQQGGRFLTLSYGANKAGRMAQIIDEHAPAHTIALGDAPNDIAMLEAADHGVIIANPHRPPLPTLAGEESSQIFRTNGAGPSGWNEAILHLLKQLDLT